MNISPYKLNDIRFGRMQLLKSSFHWAQALAHYWPFPVITSFTTIAFSTFI